MTSLALYLVHLGFYSTFWSPLVSFSTSFTGTIFNFLKHATHLCCPASNTFNNGDPDYAKLVASLGWWYAPPLCIPLTKTHSGLYSNQIIHTSGGWASTTKMTRFRPCIDIHAGQVKQIVGGTLDSSSTALQTNYISQHPPAHFAQLYRDNGLDGAHVIMLGPGNDDAARQALRTWPGGLQVGGGITDANAKEWIDAGAEKVFSTTEREVVVHWTIANPWVALPGHHYLFSFSWWPL